MREIGKIKMTIMHLFNKLISRIHSPFKLRVVYFRPWHLGSQSGFNFLDLSKPASFGLYENSVLDRFGFYRIWVGVSKSSKNRYNPMYFRIRVPIRSKCS